MDPEGDELITQEINVWKDRVTDVFYIYRLFDGSIKHKGVMIIQHKDYESKSLTPNYKKYSLVSKIMVCQSDSGGNVFKTQRYEFHETVVG